MNSIDKKVIASVIDHTVLKPETTTEDINKLCIEAKNNNFASVCINPCYVKLASENLKGTNVKVCTVIGFPLGANSTDVKAYEAQMAIADGASEVDMVINIGMLKAKNSDYVLKDIKAVVDAARDRALVKVIIETCLLTDDEKILACNLSKEAGADFVKTSTGFNKAGAAKEDVKLMRDTVGAKMGVKASGGIHTYKEAVEMLENGASRLGTSASLKIIQ